MKFKSIFYWLVASLWFGFFLFHKIDLTTADLGRHLKNGEIFLKHFQIPTTNFYSYTYPDFPVVNHHWGSGVLFYFIWRIGGFTGLSMFFGVLSLAVLALFFWAAEREAGPDLSFLASILVVPLLAERLEIRPEVFSYFFCGLFFFILWKHRSNVRAARWFWVLPVAETVWVNCHIYFFIGPVLIGALLLESLFLNGVDATTRRLLWILGAVSLATFVNPFGVHGALAPLFIFENYGYRIAENQSILFLQPFFHNPNLVYFEITFSILVLSFVLLLIRNRKQISLALLLLSILLSVMGWLALRNLAIFGFFALPILAVNFHHAFSKWFRKSIRGPLTLVLSTLILWPMFENQRDVIEWHKRTLGLGLIPGNEASAEFFLGQNISGPIMNNYDIGGYLIYTLFDKHRVFVDNRPEAYPASFFKNVYVPMQEKEEIWQEQDRRWRFNAIYFGYHDQTPWAQEFLLRRLNDPLWAPVFADNFAVIWVRRNAQNQPVILQYEVPRSHFSVRRTS